MASATDNFNRANESPLAAPWVRHGASTNVVELSSNGIDKATGQENDTYYAFTGTGQATSADQYSEIKQTSAVANDDWGPAVRIGGAGHNGVAEGYFFDPNGNTWLLARHVNGAFFIGTTVAGATLANGDVLRIEVQGTTIRGYKNGTQVITTTDANIAGVGDGAGFFLFDHGGQLDDWAGGDLGASIPPPGRAGTFDPELLPRMWA